MHDPSDGSSAKGADAARATQMAPKANILSRLFYAWFTPFAIHAWSREISKRDFFPLERDLDAQAVTGEFQGEWERQESQDPADRLSLAKMLARLGARSLAHSFAYEVLAEVCSQAMPLMISKLINLLETPDKKALKLSGDEEWYLGVGLCIAMFVVQSIHALVYNRSIWMTYKTSLRTRIGLTGLIYEKMLSASTLTRQVLLIRTPSLTLAELLPRSFCRAHLHKHLPH